MLVAAVLLCSCSDNSVNYDFKTADMLNITNSELDFQGCRSRLDAVLSAMKSKVTILENAHNSTVKSNAENEYFLEKDYVLTVFEPFILSDFDITDSFNAELNAENAKSVYELKSDGMDVVYESDGESKFVLQMVSELFVKEYSVEYNKKKDSFRYIYTVEGAGEKNTEEFLEFIKLKDGAYIIQSNTTRCYIEFDAEDKIAYFCCGELSKGEFTLEDSVFDTENISVDKNWVTLPGKSNYLNIHTYDNGLLTHEDCSSGPWKSIKINESDFASAFYAQK